MLILFGSLLAVSFALAAPAPDAKFTYIDLKDKFNHKLTEKFHQTDTDENNLAIEPGKQKLGDIEFKIGDGVIQLGSRMVKDDPERVEGIKVGQKFLKLHIIHACGYGGGPNIEGTTAHVADDTTIGEYKVTYDDKSTESIPIVYGQDVRDWWFNDSAKGVTRGQVVWKGDNELAKDYAMRIRLYLTTWENPHPAKAIASIDFIKVGDSTAAPFCVAITLEAK